MHLSIMSWEVSQGVFDCPKRVEYGIGLQAPNTVRVELHHSHIAVVNCVYSRVVCPLVSVLNWCLRPWFACVQAYYS